MGKNKIGIFAATLALSILLISSLVLAKTGNPTGSFFKDKEVDHQLQDGDILVQGEDFKITKKDFEDCKENLAFIHKQNEISTTFQSEEILNEMVEKKLLYSYAKEADIEVTDEEISEYALQTKEAFEDNATPEMERIHAELARRMDVAPGAYYAS